MAQQGTWGGPGCPGGRKIRSKGKGRGLGTGDGQGPLGIPPGNQQRPGRGRNRGNGMVQIPNKLINEVYE